MYKKNIVTFHFLQLFEFEIEPLYIAMDDSIVYSQKEESQGVFQTIFCFYYLRFDFLTLPTPYFFVLGQIMTGKTMITNDQELPRITSIG